MQTQREFLFGKGLAKAATGRGRVSVAAHDALAKAREAGISFSDDAPKVAAPKVVRTPKPVTVKVDTNKADPKAVREWAIKNGVSIGARGRIHESVYAQYFDAVAPDEVEARENELDVFGPTFTGRYPAGTKFEARFSHKGKDVVQSVNDRTACYDCRVSLSGHKCNAPRVITGFGDPVELTVIYPKGVGI
jgi:hypothetical protein